MALEKCFPIIGFNEMIHVFVCYLLEMLLTLAMLLLDRQLVCSGSQLNFFSNSVSLLLTVYKLNFSKRSVTTNMLL